MLESTEKFYFTFLYGPKNIASCNFTLKLWKRVVLKNYFSQFFIKDLMKFPMRKSNDKKKYSSVDVILSPRAK